MHKYFSVWLPIGVLLGFVPLICEVSGYNGVCYNCQFITCYNCTSDQTDRCWKPSADDYDLLAFCDKDTSACSKKVYKNWISRGCVKKNHGPTGFGLGEEKDCRTVTEYIPFKGTVSMKECSCTDYMCNTARRKRVHYAPIFTALFLSLGFMAIYK